MQAADGAGAADGQRGRSVNVDTHTRLLRGQKDGCADLIGRAAIFIMVVSSQHRPFIALCPILLLFDPSLAHLQCCCRQPAPGPADHSAAVAAFAAARSERRGGGRGPRPRAAAGSAASRTAAALAADSRGTDAARTAPGRRRLDAVGAEKPGPRAGAAFRPAARGGVVSTSASTSASAAAAAETAPPIVPRPSARGGPSATRPASWRRSADSSACRWSTAPLTAVCCPICACCRGSATCGCWRRPRSRTRWRSRQQQSERPQWPNRHRR